MFCIRLNLVSLKFVFLIVKLLISVDQVENDNGIVVVISISSILGVWSFLIS